jgi:hypothetical protein
MRKVIWGCTACAVLVAVAAVAAANHAARYPHSFIGRVLHGASHVAARLTPAVGFSQVLARTQCTNPDVIASVEGIPDEPEAVCEPAPMPTESVEPQPAQQELSSAPIVIPEDDHAAVASCHLPMPSIEPAVSTSPPAGLPVPFCPQSECPLPAVCQVAPASMPYCRDEEECEMLPMPCAEEEPESAPGCAEESEFGGCHHHHPSVCPWTGQPFPGCPTGVCPSKPCLPSPAPGGEEASEPIPGTSNLWKLPRFKPAYPVDGSCPVHPEVDTMEHRPSDGQLYEYGPGML